MENLLVVQIDEAQAFEEIYERHFNMIYKVCFSYMKNAAEAEDATADTFMKLLKRGTVFESVEHEKAWLLRAAINQCKDYLKHWWRKSKNIDELAHLEAPNVLAEEDVLEVVLSMPMRYKDVIFLYYYEGYSTVEIAEILKKPQSTIRNHLTEARAKLKGVLKNEE